MVSLAEASLIALLIEKFIDMIKHSSMLGADFGEMISIMINTITSMFGLELPVQIGDAIVAGASVYFIFKFIGQQGKTISLIIAILILLSSIGGMLKHFGVITFG